MGRMARAPRKFADLSRQIRRGMIGTPPNARDDKGENRQADAGVNSQPSREGSVRYVVEQKPDRAPNDQKHSRHPMEGDRAPAVTRLRPFENACADVVHNFSWLRLWLAHLYLRPGCK